MEMIIEQRVVRPASPLPLKRENQFSSSSLLITFKSEPQKLNICERKGNSKLSRNAILLFPYPSSKQSFDAKLSLFSLSAQALLLLLLIDYKNAIMSTKRGLAATIINCTQSRTKTGIEEHRKKFLTSKCTMMRNCCWKAKMTSFVVAKSDKWSKCFFECILGPKLNWFSTVSWLLGSFARKMALITNHGLLIPQFENLNNKIMHSAHSYFTPNALDCRHFW